MADAQNEPPLRVMVDANILVAGTVWPRWPYEVLRHATLGRFQLVLTPLIIEQARRRLRESFPKSAARLEEYLALTKLERAPEPALEELDANTSLLRDLTDIPIGLAAINARVDCFVTQDKDFTEGSDELRRRLTILLPAVFLRDYMGWSSDALEAIRNRNWSDMP